MAGINCAILEAFCLTHCDVNFHKLWYISVDVCRLHNDHFQNLQLIPCKSGKKMGKRM